MGNIIIVEALQHEPDNEPEAVTNFNAFHSDANVLTETIKKLKEKGIKEIPIQSGLRMYASFRIISYY